MISFARVLQLFILLTALLGVPAHSTSICKEIEQISAGLQWLGQEQSWTDSRGLDHSQIPGSIRDKIARLPEGSTLWNLGAGQGEIERDLIKIQKRDLHFLSFGIKPLSFQHKNITELTGQFFHEVPTKIFEESKRPDAALDIQGVLSYTTQLPEDLTRVAGAMDPGTALMMVATETRTVIVTKASGPYSLPQYLHYTLGWFKTSDHTIFIRTPVQAEQPKLELALYVPNRPSFRVFMEPGVKVDPWDLLPFKYSIAQTLEDIRSHLDFHHDESIRIALTEDLRRLQQIAIAAKKLNPRFWLPTWWQAIEQSIQKGLLGQTQIHGLDESVKKPEIRSVEKRTDEREGIYRFELKNEAKHTLTLLRLAGFP